MTPKQRERIQYAQGLLHSLAMHGALPAAQRQVLEMAREAITTALAMPSGNPEPAEAARLGIPAALLQEVARFLPREAQTLRDKCQTHLAPKRSKLPLVERV